MEEKTGKNIRILNIIDEHAQECLASIPHRSWRNNDIIDVLAVVISAYIEPGSSRENAYIESFYARMKNEFSNGALFGYMYESQVLTSI